MSDAPAAHPRTLGLVRALLRCLPPRAAWTFGGLVGDLLGQLPLRDTDRCREHLRKAYPTADAAWIARTTRRAFRHFARMTLWTAATLHWDVRRLRRHIVIEGAAHARAFLRGCRQGEGTVGFTGHFGNWELLSRVGASMAPLSVVGRRLRSPLADALVQGARTASGARLLYQDAPFAEFARELRDGRMLAVLIDQDIERLAGCFVPWFGDLAYTPNGPAAIAQLTRSAVMPVFLYWKAGRWVLHAGPRVKFPRTRDREADALRITAWATAYHEALVRRAPEQWVWWHKRWRTRPEDQSGSPEVRKSGSPSIQAPNSAL
jgi:KDO2-lipid IV(A) lauroyltransferase